jgi:hypothetical protein
MAKMTFADPDSAEPAGRALEDLNKPAWMFKMGQ